MFRLLRCTCPVPKAQQQRRAGCRPSVEALEDRTVPSVLSLQFDSLPSAQGWTYLSGYAPNSPSEMAVYSVDGTKLTQNTMGIGSNFGNYAINNAIDPTKPFTINVRARRYPQGVWK